MKEFLDAIAKWFWNPANIADSISHIALLAVVFVLLVLFLVMLFCYKRAHKITKMYAERTEAKEAEVAAYKKQLDDKDAEISNLLKTVDDYSKAKEAGDAAIKQNREFAKIFKESLIVSKKTATIAVDTTNILDALSADELKEYAEKLGAKLKSGMTKAEMIKVIRKTENTRKNLEK